MTDERLSEIEAMMASPDYGCRPWAEAGQDLVAEVRRLRRENHLLSLSRGTPSVMRSGATPGHYDGGGDRPHTTDPLCCCDPVDRLIPWGTPSIVRTD